MRKLPEVIDLFSGCGGLALGFQKAGFHITHGIDFNPSAVDTASYNLDWRNGNESEHICADITEYDPMILKDKLKNRSCIVIGGPPCQAYSKAGKAKLRSLGLHRMDVNDPRGYLYLDFIDFALTLNAEVVIMENVPDSTIYGGDNIPEKVSQILDEAGYDTFWTMLNAADYGVPQVRERVFVFAVRRDLGVNLDIPQPTNYGIGPTGRPTTDFRRFLENRYFRKPPANDSIFTWNTVYDALSDLPSVYTSSKEKYVQYPINQKMLYGKSVSNSFQEQMRTWFAEENTSVTANCFRNTGRDFQIFDRMSPGDDFETASAAADEIFEEHMRAAGKIAQNDMAIQETIKKKVIPPYDRSKFLTRWRRLDPGKPSHTVVAHLGVDTYSHIHPWEPRGITVREAARLQSFPDGFMFQCNMGDAFMQIGNAVPPLLALAIAESIRNSFKDYTRRRNDKSN